MGNAFRGIKVSNWIEWYTIWINFLTDYNCKKLIINRSLLFLENAQGNYLNGYFSILKTSKFSKNRIISNIFFVFNSENNTNARRDIIKNYLMHSEILDKNHCNESYKKLFGSVQRITKNE